MNARNRFVWLVALAITLIGAGMTCWRFVTLASGMPSGSEGSGPATLRVTIDDRFLGGIPIVRPRTDGQLQARYRSPWTVRLVDGNGKEISPTSAPGVLPFVFEGVAPGPYRYHVQFLEKEDMQVIRPVLTWAAAGETSDVTLAVSIKIPGGSLAADNLKGIDPAFFYGWSSVGWFPRNLATASLVIEITPVEAALGAPISMRPRESRKVVPSTQYHFVMKHQGTTVVAWDQFVPPGGFLIVPPDAPALRELQDRLGSEIAAHVLQAARDHQTDAFESGLLELQGQGAWASLDSLADQLREDVRHDRISRLDLENMHDTLTGQPAYGATIARHEEWVKARPRSEAACAQLVDDYIKYAWAARGSGYADTVTAEKWQRFHERLLKAREWLTRAPDQTDPYLCVAHIELSAILEEPREQGEKVFRTAVKYAPTWYTVYVTRAAYVLPRWGGAPGAVGRVGDAALAAMPGVKGEMMYARLAIYVHSRGDNPVSPELGMRWPVIRSGWQAIDAHHLIHDPEYWTAFAELATAAGDDKTAAEAAKRAKQR